MGKAGGVGGRGGGGGGKQNLCNQQQDVCGRVRARTVPSEQGCIGGVNPHLLRTSSPLRPARNPKCRRAPGGRTAPGKHPALACMPAKSPNMHWKAHRSPAICLSVLSSLFVHIRESSLRDRIWGLGLALLCCSYTTLNGSHLFSHGCWLKHASCTHIMHCQNNSSG